MLIRIREVQVLALNVIDEGILYKESNVKTTLGTVFISCLVAASVAGHPHYVKVLVSGIFYALYSNRCFHCTLMVNGWLASHPACFSAPYQ